MTDRPTARPRPPRPGSRDDDQLEGEDPASWLSDWRVRVLTLLAAIGATLGIVAYGVPGFAVPGGWAMLGFGFTLLAIGYSVGAYAAFREDGLYGMAYLFFPIYTGYYLVTRFDDLWPFFTASTIGFVMFLMGTRALQLGGAF